MPNATASDRLSCTAERQSQKPRADVVTANIPAGPLQPAPLISVPPVEGGLPVFRHFRQPCGKRLAMLRAFTLDPVVEKEEWCRITGRKK